MRMDVGAAFCGMPSRNLSVKMPDGTSCDLQPDGESKWGSGGINIQWLSYTQLRLQGLATGSTDTFKRPVGFAPIFQIMPLLVLFFLGVLSLLLALVDDPRRMRLKVGALVCIISLVGVLFVACPCQCFRDCSAFVWRCSCPPNNVRECFWRTLGLIMSLLPVVLTLVSPSGCGWVILGFVLIAFFISLCGLDLVARLARVCFGALMCVISLAYVTDKEPEYATFPAFLAAGLVLTRGVADMFGFASGIPPSSEQQADQAKSKSTESAKAKTEGDKPETMSAVVPVQQQSASNGAAWQQMAPSAAGGDASVKSTPGTIYVTCPCGTKAQQSCTGTYDLQEGRTPMGAPFWKHASAERWLYRGTDKNWYIGDSEEKQLGFNCCQGFIRYAKPNEGVLPNGFSQSWERHVTSETQWEMDSRIVTSLKPLDSSPADDVVDLGYADFSTSSNDLKGQGQFAKTGETIESLLREDGDLMPGQLP